MSTADRACSINAPAMESGTLISVLPNAKWTVWTVFDLSDGGGGGGGCVTCCNSARRVAVALALSARRVVSVTTIRVLCNSLLQT